MEMLQPGLKLQDPNLLELFSDIEYGASENEIFVTMHNYGVKKHLVF